MRTLTVLLLAALAGCGDAPTANPNPNVPEFKESTPKLPPGQKTGPEIR